MAQKLILFEKIINLEAIHDMTLWDELEKLAECVFDEFDYWIEDAQDKGEDLQCWCNNELSKAIANDYCTAFRFKSAFAFSGEGYSDPVMGWFFEPDGAFDDQIVVFTCESNGLFKNPRYVCGLLMDDDDLERLMGDLGISDEKEKEEDDDVTVEEKNKGTKSIAEFSKDDFIPSGNVDGHEYVDLGLPSGLKWAACNIGASSPEESGDYFAWGETEPKDSYGIDSYCFADQEYYDEDCDDSDEDPDNSYYPINTYNEEDGKKELDPEDDAAIEKWKGNWRMPSIEDFQELIDNCELTWGTYNGTTGIKVKGPNGSSLFLPSAGRMEDEEGVIEFENERGEYWSSCLYDDSCEYNEYWDFYWAQTMDFEKRGALCDSNYREMGRPIRPVCSIDDDKTRLESEEISDEKLKPSVLRAIHEIKEKEANADKGDFILKLVSYEGSVIKMMMALSSIDGIDEDTAFAKLQKLPAVVLEGISAKKAMAIGAMLEEAGAKVDLARSSDPVPEDNTPESVPEPAPVPSASAPKNPKPMEYVDLGLSVKWAKCNLGATAPEEFGDYYAWGEIENKDRYERNNYKYYGDGGLSKYNTKDTYGSVVDNIKQLEFSDDAARQILGDGWRMPTMKEAEELKKNCKVFPVTINGVKGLKIVSKIKGFTDKWIFLPAAGYIYSDKRSHIRTSDHCFYWTSSLYTRRPDSGLTVFCNDIYEGKMDREDGLSVRPVIK